MTAHYHQQGKAPLLCEIVTTHENGTVDLRRIGEAYAAPTPH